MSGESREPRAPGAPSRPPAAPPERRTASGLPVKPLYSGPGDDARLGRPGEFPFLRGVYPTMYLGRPWTMRQYAGFSTAKETNARFRFLLAAGQTGLSTAFDLPTQMGFDPDDPVATWEVGKVGVSVACLDDALELFDGIPLDRVSTSMTINATAAILLALYVAVGRRQGVREATLSGTIQNDILKEYAARGTFRFPPQPSLRLITDVFEDASDRLPQFNTVSVSGYHIREAGATAPQELAFTIADGLEYVRAAVARGLDVDRFAPRMSFFFNAHNDFFEEIAKFRAARRLWATEMKARFAPKDARSLMCRFHVQTAGSTLTADQHENNAVRVTLQALAAVLGGTQSLHTNGRDEALSLPSEASALLALRTQQIIAEESGVTATADPLGGSPFVEDLTDRVEAEARALLAEIDRLGGAAKAIEAGFYQREIHRSAYRAQREIEQGTRIVVGVNKYRVDEAPAEPAFRTDDGASEARAARVREVRSRRPHGAFDDAMSRLDRAARGSENLFPRILEAVEAQATLGEICARLERVFGRHREAAVL
ncbi:MAG TPA: methylmalonyl-CoA mutase family protein [Planctomycetota bacterium]|nr:methylmalonyl-CoA mutase family protein [Planctomycetota bacterium]